MKKIIVTVGPASFKKDVIIKMDQAGVDLFRINLSHTSVDDFVEMTKCLQAWTAKPICIDTEGAQLRTGVFPDPGYLELKPYEYVSFISHDQPYQVGQIPLTMPPQKILCPGDLLKIDFNAVVVQIVQHENHVTRGRVLQGGRVGTNKGISIDRDVILPAFTAKDISIFKIANKLGLQHVALSFASSGSDVRKLRGYFDEPLHIISKIENKNALNNLQDICEESDAILIDRGDLSRDVPLEKIIFAQQYIIKTAKQLDVPVYVATNLMENMIHHSKPTRAEIHDVIGTLNAQIDGLVLAAETAIGKYPVECVRIMSRIIDEVQSLSQKDDIDYLTSFTSERMIEPHGGTLVQQKLKDFNSDQAKNIPTLSVDEETLCDAVQICEGVYSPITGFMGNEEIKAILNENKTLAGVPWTLPIFFQLHEGETKNLPQNGAVLLKRKETGELFALLKISSIEKIGDMSLFAHKLFGTNDQNHPGVMKFLGGGEYLVVGKPFLIKKPDFREASCSILDPVQTRGIINDAGWHNIVGFHTRNVPHAGHEYIQREALKRANADALFISPVIGRKKKGDFKGDLIIRCYEILIRRGFYDPYGVLLSGFNTYSRYCGPREAVFTALCRKNFGCNHFIVGRDHTGVSGFYDPDASVRIFDQVETGMNIINFDVASFCMECGQVVSQCDHGAKEWKPISGTQIRDSLIKGIPIPWYMMSEDVSEFLGRSFAEKPESILE